MIRHIYNLSKLSAKWLYRYWLFDMGDEHFVLIQNGLSIIFRSSWSIGPMCFILSSLGSNGYFNLTLYSSMNIRSILSILRCF